MTPIALLLMVIAIILVWGGLVASIVTLRILSTPDVELDSSGNVVDNESLGITDW